jgi:plastocyanin
MHNSRIALALMTSLLVAACSRGEQPKPTDSGQPAAQAASPSGELTPAPGGKVIVVEMITDDSGSHFVPNEITARKGDVIRFTLKVGVHNADFYPDSNAIKAGLPATSEMLQLPGQTHDMAVTMEPGTYYFHCDPHAALGMKGHLKVIP